MSKLADMPVGGCAEFDNGRMTEVGITLRQHYAGMMLQGLISAGGRITMSEAAANSVRAADALIAELEKSQ